MYYWIIFYKDQLILQDGALPKDGLPPLHVPEGKRVHELPELDGTPCRTFHLDAPYDATSPASAAGLQAVGLRASFDMLPLSHYLMAGKAEEILHWDETVRYCSACGTRLTLHTPISKLCPQCGKEVWPTIATAIIVRITRGDEVLLVRARNFKGNYYGLVAGFLETGETLEECVRREVQEETGLGIKNIRYFGNQPWPYPCGQMIGFTAEYESGEIRLQDEELSCAAFFRYDALPAIPHKLSMARMLIDDWQEKYR